MVERGWGIELVLKLPKDPPLFSDNCITCKNNWSREYLNLLLNCHFSRHLLEPAQSVAHRSAKHRCCLSSALPIFCSYVFILSGFKERPKVIVCAQFLGTLRTPYLSTFM